MKNDFFPHFYVDYSNNRSKSEAIFQGQTYRITILTERLIRFEYNKDGIFFDDLTERVQNRNFEVPEFQVNQDEKYLEITTKYFKLQYVKEKPFIGSKLAPDSNLKVTLLNTDKLWYFHHPEARNFGTTPTSLDNNVKINFVKGLYSVDGFATIDDSTSMILMPDGYLMTTNIPRFWIVFKRLFSFNWISWTDTKICPWNMVESK